MAACLALSATGCVKSAPVDRPIVVAPPACELPQWPERFLVKLDECDTLKDDTAYIACYMTNSMLYILDAQRVYAATKTCPGIKWSEYL